MTGTAKTTTTKPKQVSTTPASTPPAPSTSPTPPAPSTLPTPPAPSTSPTPRRSEAPVGWPARPSEEAYHGVVGEFVRAVEPHTESDPAAILVQNLVAFGNVIGRGPHFRVEADDHHMNLFATLVGQTARSRKGTSLGHVTGVFRRIDGSWQTKSGLTSGEGLIFSVRDEVVDADGNVTDPGVSDKRLLVVEAEFASTLSVITRNASTLSPTLRDAWDGKSPMQVLAKNSPTIATDVHISVIGHITDHEVRRLLTESESANGFANRFLWVAAKRSKELPEGGSLTDKTLASLDKKFKQAVQFARKAGLIARSPAANDLWKDLYTRLTEERYGIVGAVTARAEAQVMRLACNFALLDKSSVIEEAHLRAGAAVWDYCDRSAQYIFRDLTGSSDADKIVEAIRSSLNGLNRTQIRDVFNRNKNSRTIEELLTVLERDGLIVKTVDTDTGGRPADIYHLASADIPKT